MEPVRYHEPAVLPRGFRCAGTNCGIKPSAPDLGVFVSSAPAAAAAVFTRNHFPGAPILVGREVIRGGVLDGIVVNSGVSNVGTGDEGLRRARRMAAVAAAVLDVPAERILPSSTGVIGVQIPIDEIEAGLGRLAGELQRDPLHGATAMMTTDTHPKALSFDVGGAVVTIVAKGAGMISPNMATMLAYVFTDAELTAPVLDRALRAAVGESFNMLSVDTDTSTSDTVAIMANGLAGPVDESAFADALAAGCARMAEILARDGEGATKLLRARVEAAATDRDARTIARAIVESPLIKTMAFGGDPNVGRILMAVGKCVDCEVEPARLEAWIGDARVVFGGRRADFDEAIVRDLLRGDPVEIRVALGLGYANATAYGCDLTHGYIDENAAYYSS